MGGTKVVDDTNHRTHLKTRNRQHKTPLKNRTCIEAVSNLGTVTTAMKAATMTFIVVGPQVVVVEVGGQREIGITAETEVSSIAMKVAVSQEEMTVVDMLLV